MRVQVILGRNDPLLRSLETRDGMQRCVSDVRVLLLEHAGHVLPPQAVAVADFLAALPRPRVSKVSAV